MLTFFFFNLLMLRVQELPGGHVRDDVRRPRHQRRRGVQGRRRRPLLLLRPAAETLRRRRRRRRPARSLIRSGKDGCLINIYQATDFFMMDITSVRDFAGLYGRMCGTKS